MEITAKIKGIKYTPRLCGDDQLNTYELANLENAFKDATFLLRIDEMNKLAVSWWVSPKRTRSYPYARVYDSFCFVGKKFTIIPIMKDEGKKGDRDFLQWDTISLMSLLGIYVIIAYYVDAVPSKRFPNKITDQKFDIEYIRSEIMNLINYQSDALHWNLEQLDKVKELGNKAIMAYAKLSEKLKIEMHSEIFAEKKINELMKDKETFLSTSRSLAKKAQLIESNTIHAAEKVIPGKKAKLTINNYLGGCYYFTADEARVNGKKVYIVEAKNTQKNKEFPSIEDVKDGLLKMVLFTNLEDVRIGKTIYQPVPVLKLTSSTTKKATFNEPLFEKLKEEAMTNGFKIEYNGTFIN